MQQITILGNVGRDAVIRDTNGRRAIGFSVAVNESYKDGQGNKVESTNWYSCTIWRDGQQSTKVADYLKAGQQVLIQGQPKIRVYQRNSDKQWAGEIEVRVDKIELVGGKKESGPVQVAEQPQTLGPQRDAPRAGNMAAASNDDDNDLPF
ncbi:single-stranded DNA-binding protein [Hymenobacter sp. BT18]|uniref:single-stranded DNA-binding protein n=1 Tax=Hymenobacter sp. BT18 TaxID=2835648 RepID=UPI00143ED06E|nr:single-stranded DNA-binding protein [Hymenobacter sp. BT18]QIX59700.1 single-stranded DNA-binding protein [Hymenobacter sp. BT18]